MNTEKMRRKMSEFNYEQELAKAGEIARRLQNDISDRVVGQIRPAWRCCCGAISCGEAQAVKITPAGQDYAYQVSRWYLWRVDMREIGASKKEYSEGLSRFIPADELDIMFKERFAEVDTRGILQEYLARKKVQRN